MKDGTARNLYEALAHSGTGKDKLERIAVAIERDNSRRPTKESVFAAVRNKLPAGTLRKVVRYFRSGTAK